jgi:A/G-specific adenine glycosylase
MLQQTQAATVIPFFYRFMNALPTVHQLAATDEQDVLRLWEGLGYYRRAQNLHRTAQLIVREHGGEIPDDPAVLMKLPGIGRYIAGAILSQAYQQRLPILEANSQRVLCRLIGLRDDPRRGASRRLLWAVAEALLPVRAVGQFNQALMELGALVCKAAPLCESCPVAKLCSARKLGIQREVPRAAVPPDAVRVKEVGVVLRRGSRILLVQRPAHGRWAGFWEFPHLQLRKRESCEDGAARLFGEILGIKAHLGSEVTTLRHSVTHHRITLVCFEASYRSGQFRASFYRRARWITPKQLADCALSAPQRRLANALYCTR